MYVDLHIHTFYSDGTHSPEEVVLTAKEKGINLISICDHCTIDAYPRLITACKKEGIKLIFGTELDVYWQNEWLHVLAYNFDFKNTQMQKLIKKSRNELDQMGVELIKNMQADYPEINLNEFNEYTYPPEQGGWKSINYIFDKGLSENLLDGLKYMKQYSGYKPDFVDISEACRVIKTAGGVSVLAHPGNWWINNKNGLAGILTLIKECGIDGVECYYPSHDEEFTRICVDFCHENNLRITSGSDGHGEFNRFVNGVEYYIGILQTDIQKLDLRGIL